MPTLDLNAVLTPIVEAVRDLLFPDLVTISARVESQDAKGQPLPGFPALETAVPAVISPVGQTERGGVYDVIINAQLVRVLLEGVHTVPLDGRITREADGMVYDVVGVGHDEARVTTTVTARITEPRS